MGYLEGGKKKEPFLTHRLLTNGWRYYYTIRRIGLFRYIRFYYNTRSLPLLHYRATIVKLYAPRFFLRLVTILFVCVPFP